MAKSASCAEIRERMESLTDREHEISREIGAQVAAGKSAQSKMREERRELRDEMEDLAAALVIASRREEAANAKARQDARRKAMEARERVEGEAEALGDEVRTAMGQLRAAIAKIDPLQSRYAAAQRDVAKVSGGRGGGVADERVTALFGMSQDFVERRLIPLARAEV